MELKESKEFDEACHEENVPVRYRIADALIEVRLINAFEYANAESEF